MKGQSSLIILLARRKRCGPSGRNSPLTRPIGCMTSNERTRQENNVNFTSIRQSLSRPLLTSPVDIRQVDGGCIRRLAAVPESDVYHVRASLGFELKAINRFRAITILSGKGEIGRYEVSKGDHLMIPAGTSSQIEGELEWIMSDVPVQSYVRP